MTANSNSDLLSACKYLARQILWTKSGTSSDLMETLANEFYRIAKEHQDFVRRQREDDGVIAAAVRYIADVHAMPPHGTDTKWFDHMLAAIIEIAVPNTGLTEDTAKLLPHLQEGIVESLASLPVSRQSVRVDEEDAKAIKHLERAGCEYGRVSDLLDLIEGLYHGEPLDEDQARLFRIAALAAPLTRQARIDEGIDKP